MRLLQSQLFLFMLSMLFLFPSIQAQKIRKLSTNGKKFKHVERSPVKSNPSDNCPSSPYRSIDGTCNNTHPDKIEWGASDIQLRRALSADYDEVDIFNAMSGADRPSARAISNALSNQEEVVLSDRDLSSFVYSWGQFLDHDITLTPEGHDEYEPVILPSDEPLFTVDIPFFRSAIHTGTGTGTIRQQTNLLTSWIDGSNVYGSEESRANWLRTFTEGKLKTSAGDLLPFNTVDGEFDSAIDPNAPSMAGDGDGTIKTFVAGDVRAAEQPGLTSLHALFVRLHNHICERLIDDGFTEDELIYQTARKEVGAIIQVITYEEFLPALGVRLKPSDGYNPHIQPDVSNAFATAAYRLGHSMVRENLILQSLDCEEQEEVSLLEGFFNIDVVRNNSIDPILKGLAVQTQSKVDLLVIDNLRNFLFGDPNAPMVAGLDLVSLNIQRGRDHGLPGYNTAREFYTRHEARKFRDITRDRPLKEALEEIYEDVNNIDFWVGLLAEDHLHDASVGKTLHNILKTQFEKLRDGDRFFYKHDPMFSHQDRDRLERTELSDVIKMVTDIERIQKNVFFSSNCNHHHGHHLIQNGTEEGLAEEIRVELYPNPSVDFIHLKLLGFNTETIEIALLDHLGRLIRKISLNEVEGQLNIAELVAGIYHIKITDDRHTHVERFVKIE